MFTDDIGGEMREQSDATDTRNASSNSERRDLELARNDDINQEQPDERPSSVYLQQSAIHKGRRSSLTSVAGSSSDGINTPDPEMENSLAYTSKSVRESIKRSKRFLPPDESNEVNNERVLVNIDLPGLFRNKLLTAAVNHAEEEKRLFKNYTPESLIMDDTNSTVSTSESPNMQGIECFDNENTEEKIPSADYSRPSTYGQEQLCMDDKTVKSESYLLDGNNLQVDSYVQRTQSAPVEVASIYTQTEWSWIEDMKNYQQMKSEMQSSEQVASETAIANEKANLGTCNLPVSNFKVKEMKVNKSIRDDDFEDELFRPPTVEYSSSSSDEDEVMVAFDKGSFLPSIGPPKILQYVKESVNPPFNNEFPEQGNARPGSSREEHSCAFCRAEVLENLDATQYAALAETAKLQCPIYHEHLKQQSEHKEDGGFIKDEIIDVRPHPPFGTKAARKEAKERAAARAREREIEKQKVSGVSVNYYAMTRQMKTLTYSLASTKCMDDGWTVRPLSPVGNEGGDHLEPFEIEINSSGVQRREMFLERFYTNGNRLLVLFPDGTGCCYYPSGNPAVIISSTEKGKYSYILQEDTYEHSRQNTGVLGVFNPTGHGSCYYHQTGKLRMVLTPFGGTFFDAKGEKKKKWFWYNITGNYVHAPPFQPITFAWTKELSLRCMGQDYILITFNHGRHTIRFNVGARLKPVVKKVKLPTDEEVYELQLKEIRKFVNLLIERVQTTLRFPHSSRIHKLSMPERRNSKPSRVDSRLIETADDKTTVVVN